MLTLGEDSYITLTDALTYFDRRLHSDAWTTASDADREKALRAATTLIDLCDFKGQRTTASQPLAWPRRYVFDREGCLVPADAPPAAIKHAACEMAIHVLSRDPAQAGAGITRKLVGDLQVDYSAAQPDPLPALARRLLSSYLLDSANTARLVP
jgi:hypothetical protein